MFACLRVFPSGYCGADIKALCTEAALKALRRRYPQIYGSSVKLKLDVTSIVLGPGDFSKAMRAIVPASQRALVPPGRALSPTLRPLLDTTFSLVLKALLRVFPHAQCTDRDNTQGKDPLQNQLGRLVSCTRLLLLSNWIFFLFLLPPILFITPFSCWYFIVFDYRYLSFCNFITTVLCVALPHWSRRLRLPHFHLDVAARRPDNSSLCEHSSQQRSFYSRLGLMEHFTSGTLFVEAALVAPKYDISSFAIALYLNLEPDHFGERPF